VYAGMELGLRSMVKEPLTGLRAIQDHVQHSTPKLVRERVNLENTAEAIMNTQHTIDGCRETVATLKRAGPPRLERIKLQLRRASAAAKKCRPAKASMYGSLWPLG